MTSEGLRMTSEGLRMTSEGLRMTSEGLRMTSEGIRMALLHCHSEGAKRPKNLSIEIPILFN